MIVNSTEERLARIETKVDMILDTRVDHETRIRTLEAWKWRITGMAAGVSGLVSLITQVLGKV